MAQQTTIVGLQTGPACREFVQSAADIQPASVIITSCAVKLSVIANVQQVTQQGLTRQRVSQQQAM